MSVMIMKTAMRLLVATVVHARNQESKKGPGPGRQGPPKTEQWLFGLFVRFGIFQNVRCSGRSLKISCLGCSVFDLFGQNELFDLFGVRTVRASGVR